MDMYLDDEGQSDSTSEWHEGEIVGTWDEVIDNVLKQTAHESSYTDQKQTSQKDSYLHGLLVFCVLKHNNNPAELSTEYFERSLKKGYKESDLCIDLAEISSIMKAHRRDGLVQTVEFFGIVEREVGMPANVLTQKGAQRLNELERQYL